MKQTWQTNHHLLGIWSPLKYLQEFQNSARKKKSPSAGKKKCPTVCISAELIHALNWVVYRQKQPACSPTGCRWGSPPPPFECAFFPVSAVRSAAAACDSLRHDGDLREQRCHSLSTDICTVAPPRCRGQLVARFSPACLHFSGSLGGMELAPVFALLLCVSLRVSPADHGHFEESNLTHVDDTVDYKDPCKAGRWLLLFLLVYWIGLGGGK